MSILKIHGVRDIVLKLESDGDLRIGDCLELGEYEEGDDLGYYQQATEILCHELLRIKRNLIEEYEKGKLRGFNLAKGYKEDHTGSLTENKYKNKGK